MSMRASSALLLAASLAVPTLATADVKTQEKTQVRFEGAIGKMVNMFGGRGAREGITSTVALKGQRMLTITGDTGEIIDLGEQKVYSLNLKDKSYTVMTFAEMRKKMEEAMAKAEKDAAAMKPEPEKADGQQKEYEVDFAIVDGTGTKAVAGTDTKEKVATITVREKGKTVEAAGGFILETHLWLAPKLPALQELTDFRMRYAQAVYGPMMAQAQPNMAQAMAMYPQMKDAMSKFADEAKKLDGTPLLTEMIFIAAVPPGSQGDTAGGGEPAPGLGGLLGGLGRFGRKKNNDAPAPAPAAAAAAPGRSTVLTTTTETLQITPSASDADVALPAGLKLK